MKVKINRYFGFLMIIIPTILFAQINWTEHTIDGNFYNAQDVIAIDLDDDNDIDVLGASWSEGDITWWENDGDENFTEHTIASTFNYAEDVYAIDLDLDFCKFLLTFVLGHLF